MAEVVSNLHVNKIKKIVLEYLKNENVKVILFGSRARGDDSSVSDVDIGIIPVSTIDSKKITLLREKIENMNIPYKVEIIDFSMTSKSFREEALKDSVTWKG
jgi:predicted nucleotidyltransferase